MRLGADYINISTQNKFSIEMSPENPNADISMMLIKLNSDTDSFDIVESTNIDSSLVIHVDKSSIYNEYILIISNNN